MFIEETKSGYRAKYLDTGIANLRHWPPPVGTCKMMKEDQQEDRQTRSIHYH
jgi:hypothetical protein